MPSSLLPSRSARISESISLSSLVFISPSCSRILARNFFLLVAAAFFGIIRRPLWLRHCARDPSVKVVSRSAFNTRTDDLARLGFAAEQDRTVDFGRLS